LGCYYANVDLDAGGLLGLGTAAISSGMIKLTPGPNLAWYYFSLNQYYAPLNQEYFDDSGAGGALFTIG
jgi:hypothetical protein